MSNYLIEIGIEELPTSEINLLRKQFLNNLEKNISNNKLNYDEIQIFSASRRFGAIVKNIDSKQNDFIEEKRGPSEQIAFKDGEPTKALQGFLRGNKKTQEDVIIKEVNGGKYVFIKNEIIGKKTKDLLPEIIQKTLNKIDFKKPMRWGEGNYKFVRPIRWITSVLNDEIVPLELYGKRGSDKTEGHRFFSGELKVNFEDYFGKLREAYVVVNNNERRERIINQLEKYEDENLKINRDEELIDEIETLTEFPTAVFGEFKKKYEELPEEIIITTIKHHQRTFPVYIHNKISNKFIAFQDGPDDPKNNVKNGYEKVINARLEDAYFYFKKDTSRNLEENVADLQEVVFQNGLGTIFDKTNRIIKLADFIAEKLEATNSEKELIERTAFLSKADLITMVVYEFPDLQGVMGRIYSSLQGENELVSWGIQEHYYTDRIPETITGTIVGIADKIDTVIGNFLIGNIPSSSKDPYALRRKINSVIEIMINNGWKINMNELLEKSSLILDMEFSKIKKEVNEFMKSRVEAILLEKGFSINVVRAVSYKYDIPYDAWVSANNLTEYMNMEEFKDLITAFQRIHNISRKHSDTNFEGKLLIQEEEKNLFEEYMKIYNSIERSIERYDYTESLDLILKAKGIIDKYFDNVYVMDEREDIRMNRLGFLKSFDDLLFKIGDLSLLSSEIND